MAKGQEKEPIETAPRDGTWITVYAWREQEPVEAHWSGITQGWTDREWRVLHLVTYWQPERSKRTRRR